MSAPTALPSSAFPKAAGLVPAAKTLSTYDNSQSWRPGNNFGGNVLYKAFSHPLVMPKVTALLAQLEAAPFAVYDPLGQFAPFAGFFGFAAATLTDVFVQDINRAGADICGQAAQPITALAPALAPALTQALAMVRPRRLLVAAFDAARIIDQIRFYLPPDTEILSFDSLRLPTEFLTRPQSYLDPLNFVMNLGWLRHDTQTHTRITSANYWRDYGAGHSRLWLQLIDADGRVCGEGFWPLPETGGGWSLDSRTLCATYGLSDFTGTLYMHVIGTAGHDLMKYAIDVFSANGHALSATHDSNPWPADFYAGIPAPQTDEDDVVVWLQSALPYPLPGGSLTLNVMGQADVCYTVPEAIGPFGMVPVSVRAAFPGRVWPAQLELSAGRCLTRPRYEVMQGPHRRIAHANVERMDVQPDPVLPQLAPVFGKGFLLPLPLLPLDDFTTEVLPTPMATTQARLPLRLLVYAASGELVLERPLGVLARGEIPALPVSQWVREGLREGVWEAGLAARLSAGGHVELCYDFTTGETGDGWLHAIARYTGYVPTHAAGHTAAHTTGHRSETSFGAHIYNVAAVYKDEPQSYAHRPPGLSTRLFLRLAPAGYDTLCHLTYPVSAAWHAQSDTRLLLKDSDGAVVAERTVQIPASGSVLLRMRTLFEERELMRAGEQACVSVRDITCRLFGFHGLVREDGFFSLDHMFGF
jgi:hypothetical protein